MVIGVSAQQYGDLWGLTLKLHLERDGYSYENEYDYWRCGRKFLKEIPDHADVL